MLREILLRAEADQSQAALFRKYGHTPTPDAPRTRGCPYRSRKRYENLGKYSTLDMFLISNGVVVDAGDFWWLFVVVGRHDTLVTALQLDDLETTHPSRLSEANTPAFNLG